MHPADFAGHFLQTAEQADQCDQCDNAYLDEQNKSLGCVHISPLRLGNKKPGQSTS